MKIFNALCGDDIGDSCRKMFHKTLGNEPTMMTFNDVTVIMIPDEAGLKEASLRIKNIIVEDL